MTKRHYHSTSEWDRKSKVYVWDQQSVSVKSQQTRYSEFKICKSMHHHTIQINQPTRCNSFSSLLLDVYVQLNMMFRASSRPSSGAQQLQQQPLVLQLEFGGSSAVGRGGAGRPEHDQQHCYHYAPTVKTRGCCCSFWAPDDRREYSRSVLSCT